MKCFVIGNFICDMLEAIISNTKSEKFFLIEDTHSAKGAGIFRAILKQDVENTATKCIHLICFENPPSYYSFGGDTSKIIEYDYVNNLFEHVEHFTISSILKTLTDSGDASTIMIDSLNTLLFLQHVDCIYDLLHEGKNCFKKFITLLHTDMIIDSTILDSVRFFSDVIFKLETKVSNTMSTLKDIKNYWGKVEILVRKPSGRVIIHKHSFGIDSSLNIYSKPVVTEKINTSSILNDFSCITTFRLGLNMKKSEKIAREDLVLPFARTENRINDSGQIVYNVESWDDLEEDPDDDLII